MTLILTHVIAGLTGIVSGALALSALKGARLHRKSGMVFVCAMLIMSATGAVMATLRLNRGNVMGGGLTFYMVATALLTTRRRLAGVKWMDITAMILGVAVGITGIAFGVQALHSATGMLDGYPPPLYFAFATIALLSAGGDLRMMLAGGLQGRNRIARHLWRMCFAMFVACGSFFLGQAKLFPKPIRIFPLLAILAFLPLALMLFWLARVRFKKSDRMQRNFGTTSLQIPPESANG